MKNIITSKKCLECKKCCIFDMDDLNLAPHLSKNEYNLFSNKNSLEKDKNFYKIKLKKNKNDKNLFKCFFLDNKSHLCLIYERRPVECQIWPFVIAGNKENVFLCIVNNDWCPAVIKNKLNKKIIKNICDFIMKGKFLDEIKNGERYLWPIENYYIKIKKLI